MNNTNINHLYEYNRIKNEKAKNTFISTVIGIHGDRYDYSKFIYKDIKTKGIVICKLHGEYLVSPNNHIRGKTGCPICNRENIKVKMELVRSNRVKNKVNNLLNESPESYYWMGFLIADGAFSNNSIILELSTKDEEHLKIFSELVGGTVNYRDRILNKKMFSMVRTSVSSYEILPHIMDKFDIKKKKTENPPTNLNIEDDKMFLYFLIGYIDGDGSLSLTNGKYPRIVIECHKNWIDIINLWICRLYKIVGINRENMAKITNRNTTKITVANRKVINYLMENIDNVPCLKRKWNIFT